MVPEDYSFRTVLAFLRGALCDRFPHARFSSRTLSLFFSPRVLVKTNRPGICNLLQFGKSWCKWSHGNSCRKESVILCTL